ncbi:MAG: sugar ABC transporter ATP-binding protein [Pseudolysinimonas sp.]|uniref:sugar ABC transporter ATP-binding protein n=1 Tax=Pseudolysinimonas sp. TaxID=2680009 RepID=UPI003C70E155
MDLDVHPGEVHALVGENGAGKSTLMKFLVGAETADEGDLLRNGEPIQLANVRDAARQGVAIVFQELSLYGDLDVLANLFLLREPPLGFLRRRTLERRARTVLDSIGLDVDLRRPVADLTLSEQQLVEIAKAMIDRSDVLILDEPNSALNAVESERLFEVVRRLRDEGTAILYVSHRLEEVFRISDRISVMRNGTIVDRSAITDTTIPKVVASMIGRAARDRSHRSEREFTGDAPTLQVEGLRVRGQVADVTFVAARGEIVGLAGLEGSGVRAVLDVLAGLRKADEGKVVLPDGGGGPASIHEAIRRGVAHVPADRRTEGVALDQSNLDNLTHVTTGALGRQGCVLRRRELLRTVSELMEKLRISSSPDAPTRSLSGGNQQKVVLGKWLAAQPRLFLFDDPTRGVDIGAKDEIYDILSQVAGQGCTILFSSTELPEYLTVCDRVLVFYSGRVTAEIAAKDLTVHGLLEAINTGNDARAEVRS